MGNFNQSLTIVGRILQRVTNTPQRRLFQKTKPSEETVFRVKSAHANDVRRAFFHPSADGTAGPVDNRTKTLTVAGVASLGCNRVEGPNSPVVRWLVEEPSACATSFDSWL